MHEVLVNRLGGLSLPRKSVVRLTDRPDMTLDVYRGRKTTMQQQQQQWVKRWPADLAVPSSSPARGEIFSTVNEVTLHTTFHSQSLIILI